MCVELENKKERDSFLKFTNDNKVMTRPIWRLMSKLPMYEICQKDDQKNALFLENRIVNIPSSVIFMSKIKPNIVLIGGGGHCISVIDVIENGNKFNILEF